ncbi:MAG: YceI family protein [Bryobacteraceae bacterium]
MTATQTKSTPVPTGAVQYTIDPAHASAQFKVRHLMIAWVRGKFEGVTGTVAFDPSNLDASKIEARIEAKSVNSGVDARDEHLRSADFLDAANFPSIEFRSTKIRAKGDDYFADGDLTIRGVTKPVTLAIEDISDEIKDPWGGVRRGATATTKINRKDFGLTWNAALEAGGFAVGDEVAITLELELIKN